MAESEKQIEEYLRLQVKAIGGKAYKFVSPGNAGVPDRLVCLPDGHVVFVELKSEAGKISKLQQIQLNSLDTLGCHTEILWSKLGVDRFILHCKTRFGL